MKSKFAIIVSLFVCMLAFAQRSYATDFTYDGILYTILSGQQVKTKDGLNDVSLQNVSSDLVLPEKVNYNGETYTVAEIGDRSFINCKSLNSVSLPETITYVNESAFKGCVNLKEINFSASICNFGRDSFSDCNSLVSIDLSKITFNIKLFETGIFSGCTSLKNVKFPKNLTTIPWGMFSGCTSLQNISIPNSVEALQSYCFEGCTSLSNVNLGSNLLEIEVQCFKDCTSLEYIDLPNSLKSIGREAFFNTGLAEIYIPSSISNIYIGAFRASKKLKSFSVSSGNLYYSSVDGVLFNKGKTELIDFPYAKEGREYAIPASVEVIREGAFDGSKIENIIFPNNLKTIETEAFRYCKNLEILNLSDVNTIGNDAFNGSGIKILCIPASISKVGGYAFYQCPITKIFYNCKTPQTIGENTYTYLNTNSTLYVPENAVELAKQTAPWSEFGTILPFDFETNNVRDIKFEQRSINLNIGENFSQMPALTTINNDATPALAWSSSNEDVATVDNKGNVIAKNGGSTVIGVSCSSLSATYTVKVAYPTIESISLPYENLSLKLGERMAIVPEITPQGTNNAFSCSSSNPNIISAYNYGNYFVLATNAVGDATISVYSTDNPGIKAEMKVTVSEGIFGNESVMLEISVNDMFSTKSYVPKNSSQSILLTPVENWNVHGLNFNGVDILANYDINTGVITTPEISEDSRIEATLEYSGPEMEVNQFSGVASVPSTGIEVYRENDNLIIKNVSPADQIRIYNIAGLLIKDIFVDTDADTLKVKINPGQVYVVIINGYATKIAF